MTYSFQHYEHMARQTATALYLYIDIETIPSQDPAVFDGIRAKHVVADIDLDAVEADKRLKAPEKIEEDLARKREKAIQDRAAAIARTAVDIDIEWLKTALDASTGQIATVSATIGEQNIASIRVNDLSLEAERELLIDFFEDLEAALDGLAHEAALASHGAQGRGDIESIHLEIQRHRQVPIVVAHHAQFDVRYIWQRAIVLGVTPPVWWPIDARPWDADRIADTMVMWAGHGNRIGLDRLCRVLGLPGKTGVDGSQVWDLVQAGRIEQIASYCDDDVRRLRSVHRRLIGLPVLDIDAIEVPAPVTDGEKEARVTYITEEIIAATPQSWGILAVEWYETGNGFFARVGDGMDGEWRMYVRPIAAGGWALDLWSLHSESARLTFGLDAETDGEARTAANDLVKRMTSSGIEDYF